MTDILLDPITRDIALTGGDLSLVQDRAAVRQQLFLRLSLQKGEWMLDLREGVPWREQVMVRNPDLQALSAIFRERILSAPDVLRLERFALAFDRATGLFSINFIAITRFGELSVQSSEEDITSLIKMLLLTPLGVIY